MPEPRCLNCGCTESNACPPPVGPCSWVFVNRDLEKGICSACLDEIQPERALTLRPVVARFALLMEAKLRMNDHKGGWGKMTCDELLDRAVEELQELITALNDNAGAETIAKETIDVANFMLMIADNATGLDCMNAGGTTPRKEEVERRLEQPPRATPGAVADDCLKPIFSRKQAD